MVVEKTIRVCSWRLPISSKTCRVCHWSVLSSSKPAIVQIRFNGKAGVEVLLRHGRGHVQGKLNAGLEDIGVVHASRRLRHVGLGQVSEAIFEICLERRARIRYKSWAQGAAHREASTIAL